MKKPELKIHAKYCLEKLIDFGAEKAQVRIEMSDKHELNSAVGEMSLYRTISDTSIELTAIKDGKKGSMKINKLNEKNIDEAAKEAVEAAMSSQSDSANDISEFAEFKEFKNGKDMPDFEMMYDKLKSFLEYSNKKYPNVIIEESIIEFNAKRGIFLNSNGREYCFSTGNYGFHAIFTGKNGEKTSSFNYTGLELKEIQDELYRLGSVDTLIKQAEEQINTQPIPENFIGDIVITPDCLSDLIGMITENLSDHAIYSDTSLFAGKLNKKIADDSFTLSVNPVYEKMGNNEFVTSDGYEAENRVLIENGELKSYLLTLYGAKKTGLENSRTKNMNYIVESGNSNYGEMIKSVERGILLCRFSGGTPAQNGDFSGIAKNSYYIENGMIKYPISETMVAGNFAELLNNIKAISSERIDFGNALLPWIQAGGITVTGKD